MATFALTHKPYGRAALDLDEAHLHRRPGVLGVRPARDQIEAAVLRLDALHLPPPFALVPRGGLHGDALDLLVLHHRRDARRGPRGMRQHPGAAQVRDVGDHAVPFHRQFTPAALQAVVQLIQVGFRLGDLPVKARDRGAFDLAVDELGELKVLAVDQDVERDLDVLGDGGNLPRAFGGHLRTESLQRVPPQVLLYLWHSLREK